MHTSNLYIFLVHIILLVYIVFPVTSRTDSNPNSDKPFGESFNFAGGLDFLQEEGNLRNLQTYTAPYGLPPCNTHVSRLCDETSNPQGPYSCCSDLDCYYGRTCSTGTGTTCTSRTAWCQGIPGTPPSGPVNCSTHCRIYNQVAFATVIQVFPGSKNVASNVVLYPTTDAGSVEQFWSFHPTNTPNVYTISNDNSGLCLDIAGVSTCTSDAVQVWTCLGNPAQTYLITQVATGINPSIPYYTIKNVNSGLCIKVVAGYNFPGARIEQNTCDGVSDSLFAILP